MIDIYYTGSESKWKKITIGRENDSLTNAKIHYNSSGPSNPAVLEKGDKIKSGKITYQVTKKKSTVAFVKTTATDKTLDIPDKVTIEGITYKVTSIADNALKNNKNVTNVTIGKNVSSIGSNAFFGCSKLTSVTIGTGVKTIEKEAFQNCKKLKTITVNSKKIAETQKKACQI